MSDTTLPPQAPTDAAGVPHSGNLGLEHPEEAFDNTTLQDAVDQGLVGDTPDNASRLVKHPTEVDDMPDPAAYNAALDTGEARRPRRARKFAALGLVVGLAAATAGVLGSRGDSEERRSDTAAGAVADNPEATSTSIPDQQIVETQINELPAPTTTIAESAATNPEGINAKGNIDITRILPGEKFMTIQRNGRDIQIPHLADPQKDPNRFAETFLAQFAAYMTTGNQEILAAMTESEEVAAKMKAMRDEDMVPRQAQNPMSQMSVKDFQSNPATFVLTPDKNGVVLQEGTVEFGEVSYDPDWQDLVHYSKPGDLGNAFKTMGITVQYVKSPDGGLRTTVSGYSWTVK